jgi:hypothetical protein
MAPADVDEEDTSSIEREAREEREELNLDDREEENDRHPLDTERDGMLEDQDGNVELQSESDEDDEDED